MLNHYRDYVVLVVYDRYTSSQTLDVIVCFGKSTSKSTAVLGMRVYLFVTVIN